jgi:hypothetical protein
MVTVLITSFLLIAAISYGFYCWLRPSSSDSAEHLLPPAPPPFDGLFAAQETAQEAKRLPATRQAITDEERAALVKRAVEGDKASLLDAQQSNDAALYDEVLNVLIEQADTDKKLFALASHIARHQDLRVNNRLAEAFIGIWKAAPARSLTAEMLHVAALSDDADVYQRAMEEAVRYWRDGRIAELGADELRQLIESEYWILTQRVRSSGAGFVLKQSLASCRRELTTGVSS